VSYPFNIFIIINYNIYIIMRLFFFHLRRIVRSSFLIIQREPFLFLGITLLIFGLLGFSNGKYCDGNPADYYTCTNTAVYYYYGRIATLSTILGAFLIAIWKINKEGN
jgi:ammonia channel protein AmtB